MSINELETLYNNTFSNGDITILTLEKNLYRIFCTNPSSILKYRPYVEGDLEFISNYIISHIEEVIKSTYIYAIESIKKNEINNLYGSVYGLNNEVYKNIVRKAKVYLNK